KRAARYDGVVVIDLDSPDQLSEIVERLRDYGAGPTFEIVKQGLPGDDPSPWIEAGATFWQPTFDPFTVNERLARAIISEGPPK
ncbi:MAG: LLM class flavin-dependent oxidoreductase, partial [Acidimicrobiales bacterium]